MVQNSQFQIYTGDSKGKTTAALGLAIRALGRSLKIAIIYFDKGGFDYGERRILDLLNLEYHITGLNRMNEDGTFRFGVTKEDQKEGERGLDILKGLLLQNYDLIICDEINTSTFLKIIDENKVLDLLKTKSEYTELVFTGRYAPKSFIEQADLVTEMKKIKHYYDNGVNARRGIEY